MTSEVTGGEWNHFTGEPETMALQFFNKHTPSVTVDLPEAYVIPPEWTVAIERLAAHDAVRGIIAGHAHQAASARFDRLQIMTAPSSCAEALHDTSPHCTDLGDFWASHRFDPTRLPAARNLVEICAPHSGIVTDVDPNLVGRGVLVLGAGRRQSSDPVDHAVGVDQLVKTGAAVSAGDVLMRVHANDDQRLTDAHTFLDQAVQIGDTAPPARQRITETLHG